jgi:hypothetical protein
MVHELSVAPIADRAQPCGRVADTEARAAEPARCRQRVGDAELTARPVPCDGEVTLAERDRSIRYRWRAASVVGTA